MIYTFIYQREYFGPSRFGPERKKKIEAETLKKACKEMLNYMNKYFNIGCKSYVYDELGTEVSISKIKCIGHMLLPD